MFILRPVDSKKRESSPSAVPSKREGLCFEADREIIIKTVWARRFS